MQRAAATVETVAVAFRGYRRLRAKEERVQMSLRMPRSYKERLDRERQESGAEGTETILDALDLQREIEEATAPILTELRIYALERGMEYDRDEAKVLAELAKLGLDAARTQKSAKRK